MTALKPIHSFHFGFEYGYYYPGNDRADFLCCIGTATRHSQ